jgi:hypothetical protein
MKGKIQAVELLENLLRIDLWSPEVRDTVSCLDRALRSNPNLPKWSAEAAEYQRQLARRLATALARIDSMQLARGIARFFPTGFDSTQVAQRIARTLRGTEPAGPAKVQKRKRNRESVAVNMVLEKIADLGDVYPGNLTHAQWAKKFGVSVRTIARAHTRRRKR